MIKVNARAARMGDSLKACCFLAVLSNFAVVQIRRNLSELLYGSCICRLSLGHTKQAPALCLVSLHDLFVSMQSQHARSVLLSSDIACVEYAC
jgi:hypothetical protein